MVSSAMGLAIFLSILNAKVVEYFVTPLFEAQNWDKRYQLYVSLVTGLLISWVTRLDLISPIAQGIGQQVVQPAGILITGVMVGGGANMIYDVFDTIGTSRELREAEAEEVRKRESS